MEVEYKNLQENIEKEDARITALNKFAGAISDAEKTADEYREERLMRD